MNSKIKAMLRKFLSIALVALTVFGCAGAAFADGSDASGTLNGVNWVYTAADQDACFERQRPHSETASAKAIFSVRRGWQIT